MSGQHNTTMHKSLPVAGYRPQSTTAVDLVNRNKETEEMILRMLDAWGSVPSIDKRWLAIGRTHMEQAWMAINRSIFKPARVVLVTDHAALSALAARADYDQAGADKIAADALPAPAPETVAAPKITDGIDSTAGNDEPDQSA